MFNQINIYENARTYYRQRTEWLEANTVIEALQMYMAVTAIELMEFNNNDDIKDVSKEKWPS